MKFSNALAIANFKVVGVASATDSYLHSLCQLPTPYTFTLVEFIFWNYIDVRTS